MARVADETKKQQIRDLWGDLANYPTIAGLAREIGYCSKWVSDVAREIGLPWPRARRDPVMVELVIKLWNEGKHIGDISERAGVSIYTSRGIIREHPDAKIRGYTDRVQPGDPVVRQSERHDEYETLFNITTSDGCAYPVEGGWCDDRTYKRSSYCELHYNITHLPKANTDNNRGVNL
jgi:hypothetical protein